MSESNTETIDCFFCNGTGDIRFAFREKAVPCPRCKGGKIPAIHAEWREKGQAIKQTRLADRCGVHDRAKALGYPASVYSDYEQGWRNPDELQGGRDE